MIKGSRAERLEYAILETVVSIFKGRQQDSWGGWATQVIARGLDQSSFDQPDLLSALKRLWKRGFLRLTKPDTQRREAYRYSGNEADDSQFFFHGTFNADITDEGRAYWDAIRFEPGLPIGFSQ